MKLLPLLAAAVLRCDGGAATAGSRSRLLLGARGRLEEEPSAMEAEVEKLQATLGCKAYDTQKSCLLGERRIRCEWLDVFKCSEREEPPPPEVLSDAECQARSGMKECQTGIGCIYDTVHGGCHANPPVCDKITCGEERQPPSPLRCYPPLQKVKPEGACCFICK